MNSRAEHGSEPIMAESTSGMLPLGETGVEDDSRSRLSGILCRETGRDELREVVREAAGEQWTVQQYSQDLSHAWQRPHCLQSFGTVRAAEKWSLQKILPEFLECLTVTLMATNSGLKMAKR